MTICDKCGCPNSGDTDIGRVDMQSARTLVNKFAPAYTTMFNAELCLECRDKLVKLAALWLKQDRKEST